VARASSEEISLPVGNDRLRGELLLPSDVRAVVILALRSIHGRRARYQVQQLRQRGLGTLLMPLLTPEEEEDDAQTGELRFNVRLLGQRILYQMQAVESRLGGRLELGILASSTAAAGALVAAAQRPEVVRALVLQGGRPELAVFALSEVQAPTLLVVGAADEPCIHSNQIAALRLHAPHRLDVIEGASHRFVEAGKLEEMADLSTSWFERHLRHPQSVPPPASHVELRFRDQRVATKND
jgi:dienelactone hydrolase